MTIKESIIEKYEKDFIFYIGFDKAIIGVVERCGSEPIVCYSRSKCIEILRKTMPEEDVLEYFEFNIIGGYIGPDTPWILDECIDIL